MFQQNFCCRNQNLVGTTSTFCWQESNQILVVLITLLLVNQPKFSWDTTNFCWLESNQTFCYPKKTVFSVLNRCFESCIEFKDIVNSDRWMNHHVFPVYRKSGLHTSHAMCFMVKKNCREKMLYHLSHNSFD